MAFRKLRCWWRDRGRVERCLLGGVAALVVLCVVVVGGRRLWRSYLIARELARIGAAGEPASAAELRGMYEVSVADEDRTSVWLKAVAAVRAAPLRNPLKGVPFFDSDSGEPPAPGLPWPKRQAAEAALKQFAVPLQAIHTAAEQGGAACYDPRFEDGFGTLLEHVTDLHAAGRLLALESHVRAHEGDARGAAASIRALFAVARSIEHEPCLVSHYSRMWNDERARLQIRRLLPFVGFSDDELTGFQEALRLARYEHGLHRALLGERAMGLTAFRDPETLGLSGVRVYAWRVFGGEDEIHYLSLLRRITTAARLPWFEAVARAREIERKTESTVREQQRERRRGWLTTPFVDEVGLAGNVAVAKGIVFSAEHTALNRAADAAIAVKRFRRRHGRLPEGLDELVPDWLPEVPEDPITGDRLRYVPGDDFYLVYSVGRDGVDNGGVGNDTVWAKPKGDAEHGETDLVFRVALSGDERE